MFEERVEIADWVIRLDGLLGTFRLVSAQYGRGSIIVTTNKDARDWPDVFAGNESLITAIPDRLLHKVHIEGRSCRLRELDSLPRPSPPAQESPSPPSRRNPLRKTG